MLLLYACHRFSIAFHHHCHLMKMITCLQCNWSQLLCGTWHFWMKRIMWFLKMRVSSVVANICYKAMYIIQSLFFILQNVYMNCIEILDTWMLHSCRNKTCIEFRDLFWFAVSNASRWCKCCHSAWKNPLRSWYYIQVLDMMQRIPLSYNNCAALTKWSPQIWKSVMICNTLVVFTSALFRMVGATVAAALTRDM
jgi:hypothetical protein